MNEYRTCIKRRRRSGGFVMSGIVLAMVLCLLFPSGTDYEQGFRIGLLTGCLLVAAAMMARFTQLLRDPARLEKARITETDERNRYIELQASRFALNCTAILLAAGAGAATFFSMTLVWVLLAVMLVLLISRKCAYLYFKRVL